MGAFVFFPGYLENLYHEGNEVIIGHVGENPPSHSFGFRCKFFYHISIDHLSYFITVYSSLVRGGGVMERIYVNTHLSHELS